MIIKVRMSAFENGKIRDVSIPDNTHQKVFLMKLSIGGKMISNHN